MNRKSALPLRQVPGIDLNYRPRDYFWAAHLSVALRAGGLCSNDPVCAQHSPGEGMEGRWLHGAACHGCSLIAETSCEMRNDYLDRALVVPTLAVPGAAFFPLVQ